MAKGRLSGVMGSVFGGGSKKDKKADSKPSKDEGYESKRTVDSTDVLHQDEGLFGKVFVLSLVEFYEAIGGRQGRIAESLPVICETVFEDQMAVGGSFSMVGDDQYVFKFANLDDRQSLLKASKIIEIIGTKLLGESFLKSGRFKALLTAVGMDDITDADGNLDREKVDEAVDMARTLPPEPSAPEDPVWVQLNYAGVDENDRWAAVSSSNKDEMQWVSMEVKKKNNDLQWTTLEREKKNSGGMQWETVKHEKDKSDLQWETVSHKKKVSGFDWQALEVEKQAERRAMLMQDGLKRFRDRRQPEESDRRMRRDVHLGQMDRRAHSERRRKADRRTG